MDRKPVVITGASGFVGRALTRRLLDLGHPVTAIANANPQLIDARADVVQADLSQDALSGEPFPAESIFFHLAARISRDAGSGDADNSETVRITRHVLAARPRRLVVLSSVAATIAEQTPARARQYGHEKAAADALVQEQMQGQAVILRAPAIYGPGMEGPLNALASLVRRGLPLPFASVRTKRPYLALANLVDLLIALASAPPDAWRDLSGRPADIHDGTQIAARDLVAHLATQLGKPSRIFPMPPSILRGVGAVTGRSALVSGVLDPVPCAMEPQRFVTLGWQPAAQMPDSLSFI